MTITDIRADTETCIDKYGIIYKMIEIEKNDLGIPLHCVDCPFIAPTLDEVRDLETVIALELATTPESQAKVEHLLARKMVKLSVLLNRTDSCPGLVLDQYVDDDWETIDMTRCQSGTK